MADQPDILFRAEFDDSGALVGLQRVGEAASDTEKNISSAGDSAESSVAKFLGLSEGVTSVMNAFAGYFTINAAKSALEDCVGKFMDAEDSMAKLTAVLKATGDISGQTAEGVHEYAMGLQDLTGITHEQTESAAALLTTFTQVRGEAFDKTLTAAADLSAVMGTSLTGSVRMLGRALQDPEHGLNALRRAGVVFTADEKEMIKSMVAAGDSAGAQEKILATLESRVGGVAAAMGQTTSGQIKIFKANLDDLQESVGGVIVKMIDLGGVAKFWSDALKQVNISLEGNRMATGSLIQVIGYYSNGVTASKEAEAALVAMDKEFVAMQQLKLSTAKMTVAQVQDLIVTYQAMLATDQLEAKQTAAQDPARLKWIEAIRQAKDAIALLNVVLAQKIAVQNTDNTDKLTKAQKENFDALHAWLLELDPVRAATEAYDKKVKELSDGLKTGNINQTDYNNLLDDAKKKLADATDKYKDLKAALSAIQAQMDPTIAATKTYNDAVKNLTNAVNAHLMSQEEYNKALDYVTSAYAEAELQTKTYEGKVADLLDEVDPLAKSTKDYAEKVDALNHLLAAGGDGFLPTYTAAMLKLDDAQQKVIGSTNPLVQEWQKMKEALDPVLAKENTLIDYGHKLDDLHSAGIISIDQEIAAFNKFKGSLDDTAKSADSLGKQLETSFTKGLEDALKSGDFNKVWEDAWKGLTDNAAKMVGLGLFGGKDASGVLRQGLLGTNEGGQPLTTDQKWEAGLSAGGEMVGAYASQSGNKWMGALGGGLSGAAGGLAMGTQLGLESGNPWGIVIGAVLGAIMGYFSTSAPSSSGYHAWINEPTPAGKPYYGSMGGTGVDLSGQSKQQAEDTKKQMEGVYNQWNEAFRDVLTTLKQSMPDMSKFTFEVYGQTQDLSTMWQDILSNDLPQAIFQNYITPITKGLTDLGVSSDRAGQLLSAFSTDTFQNAIHGLTDYMTALMNMQSLSTELGKGLGSMEDTINETMRAAWQDASSTALTNLDTLAEGLDRLTSPEQVARANQINTLATQAYQSNLQYLQQLMQVASSINSSVTQLEGTWAETRAKEKQAAGDYSQGGAVDISTGAEVPAYLAKWYESQLADLQKQLGGASSAEQVQTLMSQIETYANDLWQLNESIGGSLASGGGDTRDIAQKYIDDAQKESQAKIAAWEQEVADDNKKLKDQIDLMTTALENATGASDKNKTATDDGSGATDKFTKSIGDAGDGLDRFTKVQADAIDGVTAFTSAMNNAGANLAAMIDALANSLPPGTGKQSGQAWA